CAGRKRPCRCDRPWRHGRPGDRDRRCNTKAESAEVVLGVIGIAAQMGPVEVHSPLRERPSPAALKISGSREAVRRAQPSIVAEALAEQSIADDAVTVDAESVLAVEHLL